MVDIGPLIEAAAEVVAVAADGGSATESAGGRVLKRPPLVPETRTGRVCVWGASLAGGALFALRHEALMALQGWNYTIIGVGALLGVSAVLSFMYEIREWRAR